jgi:preprotein translocase subunit SecB
MSHAMSEQQQTDQTQPYLNIERIYLKELSLEQPNSPEILLESASPEVAVEINVNASHIQDQVYQVMITATVTTSIKERVVFLVEMKQAGIFTLRNIAAQQVNAVLEVACASVVYPYLRANLADTITRAGFAPIHLAEINFQVLYDKRMEQVAAVEQDASPTTTH